MFYILEEIVEHIMLFLNIPNRPFLTALVKAMIITLIVFIGMRIARFFVESIASGYLVDDMKTSLIIGCGLAMLVLLFDLFEKK